MKKQKFLILRTINIKLKKMKENKYTCRNKIKIVRNYRYSCFAFLGLLLLTASCDDTVEKEQNKSYITHVFEYVPAPGQFVNILPVYEVGNTAEQMCAKCLTSFNNDTPVTLGAYGGYITVGFDHTIVNVTGQNDFKVLGNAFDGSAEPGIILVSTDVNKNGIPDDDWYELAGSEYSKPATIHDYEITYTQPASISEDIKWTDNKGGQGVVKYMTPTHTQAHYPLWITDNSLTFKGAQLADNGVLNTAQTQWIMSAYDYGYADNKPNSGTGCDFNLEWAVDSNGKAVTIKGIDFIRIYTAVNQAIGLGVGEISTEIAGIEDLHPTATGE